MKRYLILTGMVITCLLYSCGKSSIPTPINNNGNTDGNSGGNTSGDDDDNTVEKPEIFNVMITGGNLVMDTLWKNAINMYMAQGFGGTAIHLASNHPGDHVTTELVNEDKGKAVIDSSDKWSRRISFSNIYHDTSNSYSAKAADSASKVYLQIIGLKNPDNGKPIILRAFLNDDNTIGSSSIEFFSKKEINFKVDVATFDRVFRSNILSDIGTTIVR